jgi:hypothetical protein
VAHKHTSVYQNDLNRSADGGSDCRAEGSSSVKLTYACADECAAKYPKNIRQAAGHVCPVPELRPCDATADGNQRNGDEQPLK